MMDKLKVVRHLFPEGMCISMLKYNRANKIRFASDTES